MSIFANRRDNHRRHKPSSEKWLKTEFSEYLRNSISAFVTRLADATVALRHLTCGLPWARRADDLEHLHLGQHYRTIARDKATGRLIEFGREMTRCYARPGRKPILAWVIWA